MGASALSAGGWRKQVTKMDMNNANSRGPENNLSSAEYRAKLMHKLNCLISVLEVALAKVRVNLKTPEADQDRLNRIRLNLENTLNVCRRAKTALEKREPMPAGLPDDLKRYSQANQKIVRRKQSRPAEPRIDENGLPRMTYRDYVEFSSLGEYNKFKGMEKITPEEVKSANIDDLAKKLGGLDLNA